MSAQQGTHPHVLMIFVDGIGLGADDPTVNPFAAAPTPTLWQLSNGQRWLRGVGRQSSARAEFVPTDAQIGVAGRPQSGTSQATILTGRNVAQEVGEHYGPRPNEATRAILDHDNLFMQVKKRGQRAALINAYPPQLHADIARGKRLPSSIQQAWLASGEPLWDVAALRRGTALSEDWTGEGWHTHLGYSDTPIYTPYQAGVRMVELARGYAFSFFSHWLTDILGHRGTIDEGIAHLVLFDEVMRGALDTWRDDEGLMLIVSDHGNFELMGDRHHTENLVPTVIVGDGRAAFAAGLRDLSQITPRVLATLFGEGG
jgi:2,3-bisphosphoglycerate-independent phosphoglycerate mutase